MNARLLDILECPFCGGGLRLQPQPQPDVRGGGEIVSGVLSCLCCTYPVVDGIPYIRSGPAARAAVELLGRGAPTDALHLLLELSDDARRQRFRAMASDEPSMTFRATLDVLSRDAEGAYLLYRISDPTCLCSEAIVREVIRRSPVTPTRILDMCGGAGHLARTLSDPAGGSGVVVADIAFWKLWLAKRFVAPDCEPVCCDAAVPLPFARRAFSLAVCSDAFHYVWNRRLLAGEIMRATDPRGNIVLPHLHNALADNPSPGMPLLPDGYRHLFSERSPRLLGQGHVLDAVLNRRPIDLDEEPPEPALEREPALTLLAGDLAPVSPNDRSIDERPPVNPAVNPLFEAVDGSPVRELRFPSEFYAQEFAECRRYLPERVELSQDVLERWKSGAWDAEIRELVARRVLLDLPERYL
jgi:uncharacterized protein YbaR (Trm112 family)/SAM-dependent methyltransferase